MIRLKWPSNFLILTSLLFGNAYGENAENTEAQQPDDWFHVEIILFAQISPLATDEENHDQPEYPARMIRISPSDDTQIQPERLSQLAEIISFKPGAERQLADVEDVMQSDLLDAEDRIAAMIAADTNNNIATETDPKTNPDEKAIADANLNAWLAPNQPRPFRSLPKADKLLNDVAGSIRRSRGYRFISHEAWRQPVVGAEQAMPILIQAGKHYDDAYEIDGTILVSKARFLHLKTNLWFKEFIRREVSEIDLRQANEDKARNITAGISLSQFNKLKTWEADRNSYQISHHHKMQQTRKMRSRTLHYIDHPYFGMLVTIEPYELPEPIFSEEPEPAFDKEPELVQPQTSSQRDKTSNPPRS